MALYAMQVLTRSEDRFIKTFRSGHPALNFPLYFLKREAKEWRAGAWRTRRLPLFPGYLFAELDGSEAADAFNALRRGEGFYRFLVSNADIRPLEGRDFDLVMCFAGRREATAEVSQIYFDDNDRIVALEGPLAGREGSIVKVDRHRRRAKVKPDLYGEAFLVNLSYEIIKRI